MRDFARLPQRIYAADRCYIPVPVQQLARQFDRRANPFYEYGSSRQFVAYEGREPAVRCAAGINPNMDRNGERIGTIGFFESDDNPELANALIERAFDWLRDARVTRVYGPMNFSIWSGYRFKTGGFELERYIGEPYNKPYYGALFQAAGFAPMSVWHSSVVDVRAQSAALQRRLEKFERRLKCSRAAGYQIIPHSSTGRRDALLRELYEIVMDTYAGFFGFYRISWREFAGLYRHLGHLIRRKQFLLARRNGCLAGFLIQYWDWAPLLRACRGRFGPVSALRLRFGPTPTRWIVAVGGVQRESIFDRSGLASALAYEAVTEMLQQNATQLIYSLVPEANRSNAFSADLDARRTTYTLYEHTL